MIVRVWRRACEALGVQNVMVASDDARVLDVIESAGGMACMTDSRCASGSERVAHALIERPDFADRFDVFINVQGDEPQVEPQSIRQLAQLMAGPHRIQFETGISIATLATPIRSWKEYENPHCVKVVRQMDTRALYFSRSPIPWVPASDRNSEKERELLENQTADSGRFLRHVGMYGYSSAFLNQMFLTPRNDKMGMFQRSPLEACERLEQLRWMELGHAIYIGVVERACHGVDTPADLLRLVS